MSQKKILILAYSPLRSDPRVLRQVEALRDEFEIEISGYTPLSDNSIEYFPIYRVPPFSLTRKFKRLFQFVFRDYDSYYWDGGKRSLAEKLKPRSYDLVIANDVHTLPLALAIAGDAAKVYFDAHEYHPREFENNFQWRLLHRPYLEFLCKKYIPKASAFSTVSEIIAHEYKNFVGIEPFVVTNATAFRDLLPSKNSGKIRLIHHTAAIRERRIESIIELMDRLGENYTLTLVLVGNDTKYIEYLKQLALKRSNIFFIPPVSFDQICELLNPYDIGIIYLLPSNFNNLNALPNKFFEFIQARLAIVSSPNPEMANIINTYKLGAVANDFSPEAMAEAIKTLTKEKIAQCKQRSHLHARTLSSEESLRKIKTTVQNLLSE